MMPELPMKTYSPTTIVIRIIISVRLSCNGFIPLSTPTATKTDTPAASSIGERCGTRSRTALFIGVADPSSYPFDRILILNETRRTQQQHQDDDRERERIAKAAQVRRQISLQKRHDNADQESAGHGPHQASHAADHDRNKGVQRQRHAHHVAERA